MMLRTAVLEFAFGFTFYLLTFFYDLWLSKGAADGALTRRKLFIGAWSGMKLIAP